MFWKLVRSPNVSVEGDLSTLRLAIYQLGKGHWPIVETPSELANFDSDRLRKIIVTSCSSDKLD